MGLKESGLRGSLRNVSVGIDAIPDIVLLPETNDLNNFSGDTGEFSIQDSVNFGTGDLTLQGNSVSGDDKEINSTSGLDTYPSVNQKLSVLTQMDSDGRSITRFGVQDSSNHYGLFIDPNGNFRILKNGSALASNDGQSISGDTVYRKLWYWRDTEPNIEFELYLESDDPETDEPIASVTANDTEYTSGGIGFTASNSSGGATADNYWANYQIEEFL